MASGIVQALALNLARRGCHRALVDRDAAAIGALPVAVLGSHDGLDLCLNNAGVALSETFEQVSAQDVEWPFDAGFWSVARVRRAFLPLLKSSDDGVIVNTSSLDGLVAPPGETAYAASKFAVRGFSQALRMELAGTRLGVHPTLRALLAPAHRRA